MDHLIEEFERMTGIGPSLMEKAAADPMLGVLAKAFSVKVMKPTDVRYLMYRKVGHGVELEDQAARFGGILTSVEPKDADPKALMAFLKKHGAKAAPKVEGTPWDAEPLEELKQWGLMGKPHQEALKKGYVNLHLVHPSNAKTLKAENLAGMVVGAMMARHSNVSYIRDPQDIVGKSKMSLQDLKKDVMWEWVGFFHEESGYASEAEEWERADKLYSASVAMKKATVKIDKIKGKTGTPGYRVSIMPHPYKLKTESVERQEESVAGTILKQMGGPGRLKAMLGAKHFIDHGNALSFQFPNRKRSKGNYVKITLRGDDTYDMEFSAISGGGTKVKKVKTYSGIMFDQLQPLFTEWTGLYLRL